MTARAIKLVLACVVIPLMLVGLIVAALVILGRGPFDGRKDIDLVSLMNPSSGWSFMLEGGYDATDGICDRSVPCVQAVDSPQMLVMRFDTQEQAAMVAERYGGREIW